MTVRVELGVGPLRVWTDLELVTAPHVGDHVCVFGETILCVAVIIDSDRVLVRNATMVRTESERYRRVAQGWTAFVRHPHSLLTSTA